MPTGTVYVPLFAGQGTPNISSPFVRDQALGDASTPSGAVLLRALHQVFLEEMRSLPKDVYISTQVDISHFQTPDSLLTGAHIGACAQNALTSSSYLFLIQSLRYLAFTEREASHSTSSTPLLDILRLNKENDLGILAFSSGILAACVVSTSPDLLSYINRSVEIYRVVLIIGIRSQLYRSDALQTAGIRTDSKLPWTIVISGMSREKLTEAISASKNEHADSAVYITAVIDDTCLTVSGRPDHLALFRSTLVSNPSVFIHDTTLTSLYHSHIHCHGLRETILEDIASRTIPFPRFSDILLPLRSALDGVLITSKTSTTSLLDLVLDTILTEPVRWDLIHGQLSKISLPEIDVYTVNVGPGSGLTRVTRSMKAKSISILDLSALTQGEAKYSPIAIVGMAVNMPGAPNIDKLWEVLEKGINTVSEIPASRFKIDDYQPENNPKRSMKTRWGHFIEDPDGFDHRFFRLSPREAKNMDPQQRVLLHTAYEALEDAGYVPDTTPSSDPERTGVYIGAATNDYVHNLRSDVDVYYSTGTLKAFLSGKISYAMRFGGPSVVVDTACSSSLVAVYHGARALANNDCDTALVGGINIITSPDTFLGLDRGHFLSPNGQCKPFDAAADGYVRGEGCGVFVLKRLSDAIAENDRIWGVIRAIEVNQSGLSQSITHPHGETQAKLIGKVLEASGLQPSDINVVEAHGTGTQAGDPTELESIRQVLGQSRTSANPLHITSVKGNIGHLEAASGAASLAKLLLMLKHRSIPRQISFNTLNPRITIPTDDCLVIDSDHVPWVTSHPGFRRIALLNNYGASGSNTALVLAEYSTSTNYALRKAPTHYVFAISSKDVHSLDSMRSNYIRWLRDNKDLPLSDIAYTSTARRMVYDHRIAVSTHSVNDLLEKLERASPHRTPAQERCSAFVFSGQGSQYLGMGQSLYQTCSFFRRIIDDCDDALVGAGYSGILQVINPDSASSAIGIETSEAFQSSLVALQYALAKLWMSWGIQPSAVIGHSLGEYAALSVAGVIPIENALWIVAERARLMLEHCPMDYSGMIAILGPLDRLREILLSSKEFQEMSISCVNSRTHHVVSGRLEHVHILHNVVNSSPGLCAVLLNVPFGYHSKAMDTILTSLSDFTRKMTLSDPSIPVGSTVLGNIVHPGEEFPLNLEYFSRHCRNPVLFEDAITSVLRAPTLTIDIWIEIGPYPQTLPFIKPHPDITNDHVFLASLSKQEECWQSLTNALSRLLTLGATVNWRSVFHQTRLPTCISLPSYPFVKERFWVQYQEHTPQASITSSAPINSSPSHPMLEAWVQLPEQKNAFTAIFETPIHRLKELVIGHRVGGVPLYPASAYLEQVVGAISLASQHLCVPLDARHVVLRHVEFPNPLVYEPQLEQVLTITVVTHSDSGTFLVTSGPERLVHARGEYRIHLDVRTATQFERTWPSISRHIVALMSPSDNRTTEVFSSRTIYEVIFPRVVKYSHEFRLIESITVDACSMEACARIAYPKLQAVNGHSSTRFLDAVIHTAGFIANLRGAPNDAYVCADIGAVKLIHDALRTVSSYDVYCDNIWVPDDGTIHIDVFVLESDAQHILVGHVKNMRFRQVRLDRLKRGLLSVSRSRSSSLSIPGSIFSTSSPISDPQVDPHPPTDITTALFRVISLVTFTPAASLTKDSKLDEIGIDRFVANEVLFQLCQAFGDIGQDHLWILRCTTIADLEIELCARLYLPRSEEYIHDHLSHQSSTSSTGLNYAHALEDFVPNSPEQQKNILRHLLASVLEACADDLGDDIDLSLFGLDSLSSIEAIQAIQLAFSVNLPSNLFAECKTIQSVYSHLERLNSTLVSGPMRHLLSERRDLQELYASERLISLVQIGNSEATSLVLVHDGSGMTSHYHRLKELKRRIWAIRSPGITDTCQYGSLREMAESYATLIADKIPDSFIIGGWSFGGVVAYEIALHLSKLGINVVGILLIDSPDPINNEPLSMRLIQTVLNEDLDQADTKLRLIVEEQFCRHSSLLSEHRYTSPENGCPPVIFLRSEDPCQSPCSLEVPVWLADRTDRVSAVSGWECITGLSIPVLDIPGDHFHAFHPSQISEISARIDEACNRLGGSSSFIGSPAITEL